MPNVTTHEPGTFCWVELGTTDDAGARAFYMPLFAWTVREISMGEMGMYYIFQKNGVDCAAMYKFGPDMAGVPPFWMSYVSVSDADATAAKAQSLGGKVHAGPFDVGDQGRMAILVDPQEAVFAVWQANANPGIGVRDEAGALCWNELQVKDLDAAKKFYPALFEWRLKESPEYTEFSVGAQAVGGMIPSQAPPEVPSYWLPYFAVDDCDASVARAQSLGGAVHAPSFDIPNVGRMAVLADPQGAPFAVIKLTF